MAPPKHPRNPCQALIVDNERFCVTPRANTFNDDDAAARAELQEILSELESLANVRHVSFAGNAYGRLATGAIATTLQKKQSLETLNFDDTDVGPVAGTELATAMLKSANGSDGLGTSASLTELTFGCSRLGSSASEWSKLFFVSTRLSRVSLPSNGFEPDDVISIVKGLSACRALEVIDLSGNAVTVEKADKTNDFGAIAELTAALHRWPSLRVLYLSDCRLLPQGFHLLVRGLVAGSNRTLEELGLRACQIQGDHLAVGLLGSQLSTRLPVLRSIDLSDNFLCPTDPAITRLLSLLPEGGFQYQTDLTRMTHAQGNGIAEAEDSLICVCNMEPWIMQDNGSSPSCYLTTAEAKLFLSLRLRQNAHTFRHPECCYGYLERDIFLKILTGALWCPIKAIKRPLKLNKGDEDLRPLVIWYHPDEGEILVEDDSVDEALATLCRARFGKHIGARICPTFPTLRVQNEAPEGTTGELDPTWVIMIYIPYSVMADVVNDFDRDIPDQDDIQDPENNFRTL